MDISRSVRNLLAQGVHGGLSASPPSAHKPMASPLTLAINSHPAVYTAAMTALERVCAALNRAGVYYAVVGGHAVALHGAVRGTVDIIIAYDLSGKQTKRIALANAVVEVLDVQALIEMKKASGRPQDAEDVRALERLL